MAPVHDPADAVSVFPGFGVPEIVGAEVMTGGSLTSPVGADAALALARLPVAVTTTRTAFPASAEVGVYVAPVAPAIGSQSAPSSRCHS